jgi:hypothetical protein
LYRLGLKRPGDCQGVPVGRLNALLQAFAPEIVSVAKWLDVTRDEPWLYARAPVPADVFSALLYTWVRDLRPEPQHRRAVRDAISELRLGELCWERREVPMLSCTLTPGGTAEPDDRLYQLLPDALADLALRLKPFSYPGGALKFRGVARRPSDRGAELLSWPPDDYTDRDGRTWWFSALLTVTLQTIPFSPKFRIHLRSGVRRWATRTGTHGLFLPPRRAASVYLLADAPWIDVRQESRASGRFSVGRLSYDRELRGLRWEAGGPDGMLSRLSLRRPFPEPGALVQRPVDWLTSKDSVTAAVVHSTMMGAHGVKAGLMPGDRVPLTEWFEQAVPEGLERVPDQVRVRYPSKPRRYAKDPDRKDADPDTLEARARRRQLAELTAGGALRLEFLWLTDTVRDAGVQALERLLGLTDKPVREPVPEAGGHEEMLFWRTPELTVALRMAPVGLLADNLAIPSDDQWRTSALHAAIKERREQVVRLLPEVPGPAGASLAILEIHRKRAYTPPSADPKFALRLGFRDAGRVTQFVNPRKPGVDTAKERKARAKTLEAAWTDGFRQLGHREVPDHGLGGLPERLQYAALWLVKRRRDSPTRQADLVPIAVRIRPDEPAPERITGWDHRTGAWVPYPELLLRLAESAELPMAIEVQEAEGVFAEADLDAPDEEEDDYEELDDWDNRTERNRRVVADAVQEVLFNLRDRPTLLLAHAQNARQMWPWLQNARIEPDAIQVHGGPVQRLAVQGPDLRLVRVRDGAHETSQWWGYSEEEETRDGEGGERFGIATGLWKDPGAAPGNRVFGSTGDKTGPGMNLSVMASRWSLRRYVRDGTEGTTIDTGRLAWNPALLEITVVGCRSDDDPELWATLTHRLRRSSGRAPMLALPLPLHLARKAAEYVLPTARDRSEEPEDDDGAVQLCFDLGVIAS